MFNRILIANRSEIAMRIQHTARRLGLETVAVYSDADAHAMHVQQADEAVHIGPSPAAQSYLNIEKIIKAAVDTGAQAIHPGYGFLAENAEFVDAVKAAGLTFIGPTAKAIRAMGLKDAAKTLMQSRGVPVVPGYHGSDQDPALLAAEAERIGYPVLIKARAGGGGKGMRKVDQAAQFHQALESAAREGAASFGDPAVLVEKYIAQPRHIEVQVFGDNHGNVVHLFERDCSLQRRHQKVIEEAPAPAMTENVRRAMTDAAITAARAIDYSGAGTVEFIVDGSGPLRVDGFWFMEMNTRLQVEHPVTEAITGLDLVEWQLRVASNEPLPCQQEELHIDGHAVEARLYAEDVAGGFLPAIGQLQHVSFSKQARVDAGVRSGDSITPFYDPMIAKLITHAPTRQQALEKMHRSLVQTHVAGTVTNLDFLSSLVQHAGFVQGEVDTSLIERDLDALSASTRPDPLAQLIAAMVLLNIDPTTAAGSWRLFGDASHLVTFTCEQEEFARRLVISSDGLVHLQEEHAGDHLCSIEIVDYTDGTITYVYQGRRCHARVVRWQEATSVNVSVLVDEKARVFTCANALQDNSLASQGDDALMAPMSGIVLVVDVQAGQSVSEGDRLLVMEAMKMETSLIAPRDGVIDSTNCAAGDSVEGGSVLVKLMAED